MKLRPRQALLMLLLLASATAGAGATGVNGWLERIGERPYQAAPGCPEAASATARPAGQPPAAARYAVCADQAALLREAIKASAERKRLLLVVFGATWCPWCGALQRQLESGEIAGHAPGVGFDVIDLALSTTAKGAQARAGRDHAAPAAMVVSLIVELARSLRLG